MRLKLEEKYIFPFLHLYLGLNKAQCQKTQNWNSFYECRSLSKSDGMVDNTKECRGGRLTNNTVVCTFDWARNHHYHVNVLRKLTTKTALYIFVNLESHFIKSTQSWTHSI